MLVLSRKNQESIVVTEPGGSAPMLKVTVIQSKTGCVRLGFEAPNNVLIHRNTPVPTTVSEPARRGSASTRG